MKSLFIAFTMILSPVSSGFQAPTIQKGKVYICTGPQSKRYHRTSSCRGLNSCSGDIKAVTLSYAKSIGRTPCGWCF